MASVLKGKSEFVKAGSTLALGLVILAAFMVVLGGNWFWERYDTYDIMFSSVKDLSRGRTVKYAGLDVGRVKSIDLDPNDPRHIRVRIDVHRDFPLYEGTTARISQKGLVGDYYVLLELQGEPGARLTSGSTIPSAEMLDMSELVGKVGKLLDEMRPKLLEIESNLAALVSPENAAAVHAVLKQAPQLIGAFESAATDFRKNWEMLSTKGGRAAESVDAAFKRLDSAVANLEVQTKKTLETVRTETQAAGDLARDTRRNVNYDQEELEDILANIKTTSRDLKELTRRVKERPWELIRPPSGSTR